MKFLSVNLIQKLILHLAGSIVDLRPFPAVKHYLKMNLSQVSAKKAFAADIIQPYLT